MVIDHLRKEWNDQDKKVGDIIFTKLTLAQRKSYDKSVREPATIEPVGETWLFDTLSEYLNRPKGALLGKIRNRMQNPDVNQKGNGGLGG